MHFSIPYFKTKFKNHNLIKDKLIDIICNDTSGPNLDKKDQISKTTLCRQQDMLSCLKRSLKSL